MNKLEFTKTGRWRIYTYVAGKKKIVDASTELFSSKAKAKKNLLATRKRMNKLTDEQISEAYKNPVSK